MTKKSNAFPFFLLPSDHTGAPIVLFGQEQPHRLGIAGGALVLWYRYAMAKQFYYAATEKGYYSAKYFWIPFAALISGYLLIVALPDKTKYNIKMESDATALVKYYKDLLDAGAITQEKFDAKTKQILGL